MDREEIFFLGLTLTQGVGKIFRTKLQNTFSSYEEIFSTSPRELKKAGIGEKLSTAIHSKEGLKEAESLIEKHEKNNIKVVTQLNSEYPTRLLHTYDAPTALFCKGNFQLNCDKVVAIVGTRNASKDGKKFIEKFIESIAGMDILIISGLAYGVDIEAHKNAMKNNLKTAAIYGGGIDMVYPADHKDYADQISASAGLITEYPMGTKVETYQFVARNRIIAGCSDAVIVVEAPEKSGALLTSNYAAEYNREIFAVPGSIFEKNYVGCNNLIKKNLAHMIISAEDFLQEMNWKKPGSPQKIKQQTISFETNNLSENEKKIFDVILKSKNKKLHIDEIQENCELNPGMLASLLLQMEMEDFIISLPGKYYAVKN